VIPSVACYLTTD